MKTINMSASRLPLVIGLDDKEVTARSRTAVVKEGRPLDTILAFQWSRDASEGSI